MLSAIEPTALPLPASQIEDLKLASLDFRQRNCTPNLGWFLLETRALADLDMELAPLPPRHGWGGIQEITG